MLIVEYIPQYIFVYIPIEFQILEINDNGIYSAVEVQERNDIKTGGIYQVKLHISYSYSGNCFISTSSGVPSLTFMRMVCISR